MAIPLRGGSAIKAGAISVRASIQGFANTVTARGIGRVRALDAQDQERSQQARKMGSQGCTRLAVKILYIDGLNWQYHVDCVGVVFKLC